MSKTHTIRVKVTAGADAEVHVRPSKRSAFRYAYENIGRCTEGGYIEVFAGNYEADRRVLDGEPIKKMTA